MAHSTLILMNPFTKETKKAPIGYSWTMLFWGFFVPMIRGDWKWCVIILALCLILAWLPAFIFSFLYNKIFVQEMLQKGWVVAGAMGQPIEAIANQLGMQLPVVDK